MLHNVLIYVSFTSTYLLLGKYSLNTLINVAALFGHLECLVHAYKNMCFVVWKYVWKYVQYCLKSENMCLSRCIKGDLKFFSHVFL